MVSSPEIRGAAAIEIPGTNLERMSLSEQALAVIRQAMVSGEIRAGEIYSAAALATQLGVSNSPVREAMLTLVNEGLMVAVRNRGYQVVPITDSDMENITDIRLLLELPTMVSLAEHHDDLDLERFESVASRIVEAAKKGDITTYLEFDRDFHLGLMELARNPRLTKLVGNLRDQTRLYGLYDLSEQGRLSASAQEHLDILKAIASGDSAETDRLMRMHLGHITREWSGQD